MFGSSVLPNEFTFATVINACSMLADLKTGTKIHAQVEVFGLECNLVVCSSLVDMLVSGKVTHGAVIRCGHDSNYVVANALVDMYAKCGCVTYSNKVFQSISHPCVIAYTSMIVASRLHGRVDIAVEASKQLIESNQEVVGAYVTLSNTYALAGEWENAHSLRSEMKRTGIHKVPGCSWVEIKNETYVFYAGDALRERGSEVGKFKKEVEEANNGNLKACFINACSWLPPPCQ
ncbi:hypothetical protein Patl1_25103 [Pistacia atlantica]|uniref:Uncharacterized protein n=1 Tax=Pistacia atlantica TaxID=434234 RepID=A0ACC1B3Z2_9ROSI|nr:hypothetical protein Patl1_25103 [Pistacia atlantica]